jgi:hypothetical protein
MLDFDYIYVGKTTYCQGMQMFMKEIARNVAIVNLDFANDALPYGCAIDVRQLITLQVSMSFSNVVGKNRLIYSNDW